MWHSVVKFFGCGAGTGKRPYPADATIVPMCHTVTNVPPVQTEELEPMILQTRLDEPEKPKPTSCCPRALKVCCGCCCGILCLLLAALAGIFFFAVGTLNIDIERTEFTFWNYYVPQFNYVMAGRSDTTSWTKWYKSLATDKEPHVGVGLGPNTRTYYSYVKVRNMLQDFAVRIPLGTMKRHNELGMTLLSDAMWPETGTAVTGLTNSDHAAVRPYLAAALDGAEGGPDDSCDGSKCWSLAWLRKKFKERFAGLDSFSRDDLLWMISAVLHKVHLNLDFPDAEIKDFAAFQQQLIKVVPFKRNWFWETLQGTFPRKVKRDFEETYKAAIQRKWPEDPWTDSPAKLAVLTSAMLDSLAMFGGASISTALDFLLSIMFMEGEPGRSARPLGLEDQHQLHNFIWETLRRYPPIVAVPRWVTEDGGRTWKHEVLSLFQALQDEIVFPDPLAYTPGRPGLNHEDSNLSIGWADFAMVNGDVADPNSHSCPGKQLSFRLITAFIQELLLAGPWEVDNPAIHLNSYGSSGFTLRKRPQQ